MTAALILLAGVLVGWLARSHRAHVLARRRRLAETLRRPRPQTTADARARVQRVDVGLWDADVEATLPPDLRRRSTST